MVDLCYGLFKSKLFCPNCNKISIIFDSYSHIPLPIPQIQFHSISCYIIPKNEGEEKNIIKL